MPQVANSKCSDHVKGCLPFTGSNLKGVKDSKDNYVVISYKTPILAKVGNVWYENSKKYSQSTSRQMSYARLGLVETTKVSPEELENLLGNY